MPVTADDIAFFLSGGLSNSDPNLSLGGGRSATDVSADSNNTPNLDNLFDHLSQSECKNGDTEYRCIYFYNMGTLTITNIKLWFSAKTPANDKIMVIATGKPKNFIEPTISSASTNPYPSITPSQPTGPDTAFLALPDLGPQDFSGVWLVRITPANTPKYSNNFFEIRVDWDSPA